MAKKYGGGIGAPKKEDKLKEAADLYLQTGVNTNIEVKCFIVTSEFFILG